MNIFNETSATLIREASKCDRCNTTYECDDACDEFEDTMSGLKDVDMSYTIDSIPIMKTQEYDDECEDECDDEFGNYDNECCKESYLIEYDMLMKLMESENIYDPAVAHKAICEYYHIPENSLVVVFESKAVNKRLVKSCKKNKNCSTVNGFTKAIRHLKNKGIRCAKKKSK